MGEELLFDATREALWTAVVLATPVLGAALVTGLVIGLLQALTSIQEMTLTFVPKILAMLIVFWITMDFMSNTLASYFTNTIIPMIKAG